MKGAVSLDDGAKRIVEIPFPSEFSMMQNLDVVVTEPFRNTNFVIIVGIHDYTFLWNNEVIANFKSNAKWTLSTGITQEANFIWLLLFLSVHVNLK